MEIDISSRSSEYLLSPPYLLYMSKQLFVRRAKNVLVRPGFLNLVPEIRDPAATNIKYF